MLAWRSLGAHRSRTILSIIVVAVGVATTIAVPMVAQAIRAGLLVTDEIRYLMEGLIKEFDPFLTFIGLVIMGVAGFMIYNAFAMSVTQRRQQIGSLRALGLTRGQMRRLLIVEALVLGVIGVVLGVLAGPPLGLGVVTITNTIIGTFIPLTPVPATPDVILPASGMGLAVTLLAALLPARRAMRTAPLEALRGHEAAGMEPVSPWRARLGLGIALALLIYVLVMPPGAWVNAPTDAPLAVGLAVVWIAACVLLLPALIGLAGRWARGPLTQRFHAVGRLVADNIQRGRARVTLTTLTIAAGLLAITGLTGFVTFIFNTLMVTTLRTAADLDIWYMARFDPAGGWANVIADNSGSLLLSAEEMAAITVTVGNRAIVAPLYFVVVPELSFFGDRYFSFLVEPEVLYRLGGGLFTFVEGDWDSALPILRGGCGVLITPLVAARNNGGLGEPLAVSQAGGIVECTVAGIGQNFSGASIISGAAPEAFGVTAPTLALILPQPAADTTHLEADLRARLPGLPLAAMRVYAGAFGEVIGYLTVTMNIMLLLAVLAAAMGVINTTVISISERRREIGLLRAVGSTRRQTRAVLMGEAALMGLVGGGLGLLAGLGFTLIFVVSYGGRSWGLPDLPLWPTALAAARPALGVGLFGLLVTPVITALAAWVPTRAILREKPIETLALR